MDCSWIANQWPRRRSSLVPSLPRQVVSDGRLNFMAVASEGRHADFPESEVIAVTQPGPKLAASQDVSLIACLIVT